MTLHGLAQKYCEFPLSLFFANNKRGYTSRAGKSSCCVMGHPPMVIAPKGRLRGSHLGGVFFGSYLSRAMA